MPSGYYTAPSEEDALLAWQRQYPGRRLSSISRVGDEYLWLISWDEEPTLPGPDGEPLAAVLVRTYPEGFSYRGPAQEYVVSFRTWPEQAPRVFGKIRDELYDRLLEEIRKRGHTPLYLNVVRDTRPTFYTRYAMTVAVANDGGIGAVPLIPIIAILVLVLAAMGIGALVWNIVTDDVKDILYGPSETIWIDPETGKQVAPQTPGAVPYKRRGGGLADIGDFNIGGIVVLGIVGLVAWNMLQKQKTGKG